MVELWGSITLLMAALVCLLMIVVMISLYGRIRAILEAKLVNERRVYVHETGAEAYAFAESLQPEANRAEKLERAVDYMRRQYLQRRIPFDYEQARAVIEKAAMLQHIHHEKPAPVQSLTNTNRYRHG